MAALTCLALAACTADDAASEVTPTPSDSAAASPSGEYLPDRIALVTMPAGEPEAMVVVVPGGGFHASDPTGFMPLAEDLAAEGFGTVAITYGHRGNGVFYPRPVQDVACAVAYAATQAPDVPVVVVGHSAGANLALLVGLQTPRADMDCRYEPRQPDALVGLAGPYDIHQAPAAGRDLFGVAQEEDPELWRDGNPLTWAGERPDLPVLLVHGDADVTVGVSITETMAAVLTEGGHDVTAVYPAGAGHNSLITSEWVLDDLVTWIRDVVLAGQG